MRPSGPRERVFFAIGTASIGEGSFETDDEASEPAPSPTHAGPDRGGRAIGLTIEQAFGKVSTEGGRGTKHDAERKQKIIEFIAATLRARGYPPSVREIATAVGLASTSAVHHHLMSLEREGYLERDATQSRAMRLKPAAALRAGMSGELVPQLHGTETHL